MTFISGERVNGIQRIRYARKVNNTPTIVSATIFLQQLDSGDVCDRPFMQTGATRIVWGYGEKNTSQ